jgi:DNA repair exonuclease SbcCD nuclease subunit
MIFAFMADIHLSRYSQDKVEENLPERLHSIKRTLYEVGDYCVKNKIEDVVIGGDILHGKSIIYAIAQEIMLQYFEDYMGLLRFRVIDGNHDLSGKGEDVVSALRSLRHISNVSWVPYSETYHDDKNDILYVPYSTKLPSIIKDRRSKILVSHFGLSEGILNSGMSIVSDISLKDLIGKYQLVLLGHYHKPQEIIRDDISLYYVGSSVQLDWGEKNDEKRFLVVDSDTCEVESIPTSGYKKHVEIELTNDNREESFKLAEEARASGDHVKIVMKEKVDLTGISEDFNIVDKTEVDITDRGISKSMTEEDKLSRYMEIKEIPEDKREKYLNVALESIQSCEV